MGGRDCGGGGGKGGSGGGVKGVMEEGDGVMENLKVGGVGK